MMTKRLTAEDLAAIELRANEATSAPWRACGGGDCQCGLVWSTPCDVIVSQSCRDEEIGSTARLSENAAFIAAARTDVPDLIAEVRALTAERDELRAIVEGRKVAPTEAEFAELRGAGGSCTVSASYGDGACRVLWSSREGMALMLRGAEYVSTRGYVVAWRAFDASGRPCAWPKVTR